MKTTASSDCCTSHCGQSEALARDGWPYALLLQQVHHNTNPLRGQKRAVEPSYESRLVTELVQDRVDDVDPKR